MTKTLGDLRRAGHQRREDRRRRRKTRRAGRGSQRRRHLEGPDRQRQPAREQPDRPGPKYRRGHDRGRQGRPLEEDHRRRRGEVNELKNTINTMVDQLRSFAAEVTRVAIEVGTEGKLGGQADVKDVSGTWKDLTDNVNVPRRQSDRPGPQHRQGHDGGRQRRPLAEDHGRRQGRDSRAEEHHQHDGRSASIVRRGSHPRRQGGRHRRKARRPGRSSTASRAPGRI